MEQEKDIVERIKLAFHGHDHEDRNGCMLCNAAEEIERLRALLKAFRDELLDRKPYRRNKLYDLAIEAHHVLGQERGTQTQGVGQVYDEEMHLTD